MDPALLDRHFPRYTRYKPRVPVWIVTPETPRCLHRFFSSSPVSPSGRYLAVTQMPFEDRLPKPGDVAQIVLVDLETGQTRSIAETRGWESQLGAQAQWGSTDEELFFNDVQTTEGEARPVARQWKLASGQERSFPGGLYHASPCGRWLVAGALEKMLWTQKGYGVLIDGADTAPHEGFPAREGLWITDTHSGQQRLILSLAEILRRKRDEMAIENPEDGAAYVFHCQFNQDASRIYFSVRWAPPMQTSEVNSIGPSMRFNVFTVRPDGSDLHVCVNADHWARGPGHHTVWAPDGQHLTMNLTRPSFIKIPKLRRMKLHRVRYDGSQLEVLAPKLPGSGHPVFAADNRHMIADTYTYEPVAFGDGTIPLRWIDTERNTEECLVRINTAEPSGIAPLRVDAHPAWDRSGRFVIFNAFLQGTRRVLVADLQSRLNP